MSDNLIKQWDEYVESMGSVMGEVEHMAQQMRDRIEELERDREKLGREVNMAKYGEPNFAWSIHNAAMADLKAKLAKAVEALREVTQTLVWKHFGSCRGYSENLLTPNEAENLAKAVLAELEGKDDQDHRRTAG